MGKLIARIGYAAAVGMACVWAFLFFIGPNGIQSIRDRHEQILKQEKENEEMQKRVQEQEKRNLRLMTDPKVQDREVRKQRNQQREGEKTIYTDPPPSR